MTTVIESSTITNIVLNSIFTVFSQLVNLFVQRKAFCFQCKRCSVVCPPARLALSCLGAVRFRAMISLYSDPLMLYLVFRLCRFPMFPGITEFFEWKQSGRPVCYMILSSVPPQKRLGKIGDGGARSVRWKTTAAQSMLPSLGRTRSGVANISFTHLGSVPWRSLDVGFCCWYIKGCICCLVRLYSCPNVYRCSPQACSDKTQRNDAWLVDRWTREL